MRKILQRLKRRAHIRTLVIVAVIAMVSTAIGVALVTDIATKKGEQKVPFYSVTEITDQTDDPAEWGKNFPLQYESYLKTVDQTRTKYGGSEAVPRAPDDADPRSVLAQSRLEEDPRLKSMWAGYAFSKDFREERGHAHMFIDQIYTERQKVVQQPGTCINCHASTYNAMMKLGEGDLTKGFEKINKMPYQDARKLVNHPVSCLDCHAPKTMQLRVTRPAFMEGIKKVKEAEGIKNYDVNKMASHQQMRTFVCAQCHVEYHFKGPEKRLTFPWDKGLQADKILAYYDEAKFKDWEHKETGAPALKAQHPEFEMYSQGIHARSGVSCADCHMPYQRVGAAKVTDHHVRSPVLNLGRACQTCHSWPEQELKARVEGIQDRTFEIRNHAMDALMALIKDLKETRAKGGDPAVLAKGQDYQRKAQFLLDFVEAENSMGFHAPEEALRVLSLSLDYTRKGQETLRRLKVEKVQ